jgi:hypothetical protein
MLTDRANIKALYKNRVVVWDLPDHKVYVSGRNIHLDCFPVVKVTLYAPAKGARWPQTQTQSQTRAMGEAMHSTRTRPPSRRTSRLRSRQFRLAAIG